MPYSCFTVAASGPNFQFLIIGIFSRSGISSQCLLQDTLVCQFFRESLLVLDDHVAHFQRLCDLVVDQIFDHYQSGDEDAEDPYCDAGDTIHVYAFVVFNYDDVLVDLFV